MDPEQEQYKIYTTVRLYMHGDPVDGYGRIGQVLIWSFSFLSP